MIRDWSLKLFTSKIYFGGRTVSLLQLQVGQDSYILVIRKLLKKIGSNENKIMFVDLSAVQKKETRELTYSVLYVRNQKHISRKEKSIQML